MINLDHIKDRIKINSTNDYIKQVEAKSHTTYSKIVWNFSYCMTERTGKQLKCGCKNETDLLDVASWGKTTVSSQASEQLAT